MGLKLKYVAPIRCIRHSNQAQPTPLGSSKLRAFKLLELNHYLHGQINLMSITNPSIGSSIGGLCVQWLILLLVPKQRYNPKLPSQPPGRPQINSFEHTVPYRTHSGAQISEILNVTPGNPGPCN